MIVSFIRPAWLGFIASTAGRRNIRRARGPVRARAAGMGREAFEKLVLLLEFLSKVCIGTAAGAES